MNSLFCFFMSILIMSYSVVTLNASERYPLAIRAISIEVLKASSSKEGAKTERDFIQSLNHEDSIEYGRWQSERSSYDVRVKHYKQNLIRFDNVLNHDKEAGAKESRKILGSQVEYIPMAFKGPIRDQGARSTSSAFAAIKAMEILIEHTLDLSEHYFYYLTLPECMNKGCNKSGAWISQALHQIKKSGRGISLESKCPYYSRSLYKNETHTPLSKECFESHLLVESFSEMIDIDDVLKAIINGNPVIGAFRLDSSFYAHKGFVQYDEHVIDRSPLILSRKNGHSLLFVGIMKLPRELKDKQGNFCLLTINSWGEGWGQGGYGCLTEKWILNHRVNLPYIAISKVTKVTK